MVDITKHKWSDPINKKASIDDSETILVLNTYADFLISKSDVIALAEHFGLILTAKEQRIIGIEMLVEEFGTDRNKEISLHDYFEITPNEAYDYCDEIYGGDSQHIRAKAEPIKLSQKIQNT